MKYFYKDPLAAAGRAKHFGIKYLDERGQEIEFNSWHLTRFKKAYIHPDSLHLLGAQENDRVDLGHGLYGWIRLPTKNNNFTGPMVYRPWKDSMTTHTGPLDKRNGISFMWPESEP